MKACNFTKYRPQYRCFLKFFEICFLKFAKFLRTPFLYKTLPIAASVQQELRIKTRKIKMITTSFFALFYKETGKATGFKPQRVKCCETNQT